MQKRIIAAFLVATCATAAQGQYKTDKELQDEQYQRRQQESIQAAYAQVGKRYWYRYSDSGIVHLDFWSEVWDAKQMNFSRAFHPQKPVSFVVTDVVLNDSMSPIVKIQLEDGVVAYVRSNLIEATLQTAVGMDVLSTKSPAERKAIAAKQPKKQGVTIGMTKNEVLASSWGRPKSINKTTSAYGTHEQWVYGGGYLYFENGVLTTIQN